MNDASKTIPERLGVGEHDFRVVVGRTRIEYDSEKEAANREKHKYSLESAVHLLEKWLFLQSDPFGTYGPFEIGGEWRHKHLGIGEFGEVVFMVTTMRPNEVVRVISFRRANKRERELFSAMTGYNEERSRGE